MLLDRLYFGKSIFHANTFDLTSGPASPTLPRTPGGPIGPRGPGFPSFPEGPTGPGGPCQNTKKCVLEERLHNVFLIKEKEQL